MRNYFTAFHKFQDILDEADKDRNGLIDYKEFAEMMGPPGRSWIGLYITQEFFYHFLFIYLFIQEVIYWK